ncbi:MAG: nucleotidyltransferase family protein, partial [Candidatus Acidiferrum sp.]
MLRTISWPALFTLAEEHGVIALLAAALRRFDDGVARPDITQKIHEYHRAQVLSAMKMTAELFRLVDLFRAAALETVLVKGPTLAMRAYGDTGSRIFGD